MGSLPKRTGAPEAVSIRQRLVETLFASHRRHLTSRAGLRRQSRPADPFEGNTQGQHHTVLILYPPERAPLRLSSA